MSYFYHSLLAWFSGASTTLSLRGSWWGDHEETWQDLFEVSLGLGSDTLISHGHVDRIYTGSGHDTVKIDGTARFVDLGANDDYLETTSFISEVVGGSGHDTLKFKTDLSGLDVSTDWLGRVTLQDRLTGETMNTSGMDRFVFNDADKKLSDMQAFDQGSAPKITVADGTGQAYVNDADPSVNVVWSRALHEAITHSDVASGPTIAARAMAMVHTAIYDAWASFDRVANRVSADAEGDNASLEGALPATEANLTKAMCFAAFTVLCDLYPDQKAMFSEIMVKRYGLNPNGDGSTAAEIGLDAGQDMIAARANDGSNQQGNYASTVQYTPVNPDGEHLTDMDRWTPENVPNLSADQMFLTPHWGKVDGFAIGKTVDGQNDMSKLTPPGPERFLMDAYKGSVLDLQNHTLTLSADAVIDGVHHSQGDVVTISKAMIGVVINEGYIAQAQQVVDISANLTDKQKVIAEFWEDGAGTSYPPGTAMFMAEYVSARDGNSLSSDAKLFMTMANAQLDASIAAWEAKLSFDYCRPVRAIRCLGELGLIGEEGVDEVTGQRGHVVRAWAGTDADGNSLGVRTILATNFVTYQQPGADPSPPFAEYVSGHSTFSASGAKVLALITGSDYFGGTVQIDAHASRFEPGSPVNDVTLHWETFSETAQQSGISRLYGGIHFNDGNQHGLALGADVGQAAYDLAQSYINGIAGDSIA